MQAKLYQKDGTYIKDFQVYSELDVFQDTEVRVCSDLSGNIGDVAVVTNNAGVEYTGEVIGYNKSVSGNYITLKHIIYDLNNYLMTNTEYSNEDVGVIFTAILEDYLSQVPYFWIDGLSDIPTGKNIDIKFEDKTHLEAISLLQNYLTDYRISFKLGGQPVEIGLIGNDTATNLDNTRIISTGDVGNYDNVINYVIVKNGDGIREVVQDTTSINDIGRKIKTYLRPSITTTSDALAFGESIIERYSNPYKTVEWIEVNQTNLNLYNKKVSIDGVDKYVVGGKINEDTVKYNVSKSWDNSELISIDQDALEQSIILTQNQIKENNDLVGLRGWTTDILFTPQDYNTVTWSAGDINMPNGDTYNITASNTGNMSSITYVYLDTDISTTALQTTTVSSNAVGNNKLLVCVANPNSEITKDAVFQAFGTGDQSSFVSASNIAANSITGNEIQANSLTATQIDTTSINITEWNNAGALSTGDNLDDVSDGSSYGKVLNTYLEAGRVKLLSSSPTATKTINIDADVPDITLDNGGGDKIRIETEGTYPEIEFSINNSRVGDIRAFSTSLDGTTFQGVAINNGNLVVDGSVLSDDLIFCGTSQGTAPIGTTHSARIMFGSGIGTSSARFLVSDGSDLKRYDGSTYTSVVGGGTSSWVGSATSNLDMNEYDIVDLDNLYVRDIYGNGVTEIDVYESLDMNNNNITDIGKLQIPVGTNLY